MTRLCRIASAAVAALALTAGASAASAQNYVFSNPGEAVTVSGVAILQVWQSPSDPPLTTVCNVVFHGQVAWDASHITLTDQHAEVVSGPLPCEALNLPVTLTAYDASTVDFDSFALFSALGPCVQNNYRTPYWGNEIFFNGLWFGDPPICSFDGALSVTSDVEGEPVVILES